MRVISVPDAYKIKLAADLSAVSVVNEETKIFFVDGDGELSYLSTGGSAIVPQISTEPRKILVKGRSVKVSASLKSIGATAYEETRGHETTREIRLYFADPSNVLAELCQTWSKKTPIAEWKLENNWSEGYVGSGKHRVQLAETSSISAAVFHRLHNGIAYAFIEVFYTGQESPDLISCVYLEIKGNEYVWSVRTVGARPVDHVERISKENPQPQPEPPIEPLPKFPSDRFSEYHVTVALGFGFFFGLVAGLVLDRPLWKHGR